MARRVIDEALRGIDDPELAERVKRVLTEGSIPYPNPWLAPSWTRLVGKTRSPMEAALPFELCYRTLSTRMPTLPRSTTRSRLCSAPIAGSLKVSCAALGLTAKAILLADGPRSHVRRKPEPVNGCPAIVAQLSEYDRKALADLAQQGCPHQAPRANKRPLGVRACSSGEVVHAERDMTSRAMLRTLRHGRRPPLPIDLGPARAQPARMAAEVHLGRCRLRSP